MLFFTAVMFVALSGVTLFAMVLTEYPSQETSGVIQVFFLCLMSIAFYNSLGPVFWCYATETCQMKGLSLCVIMNWAGSLCINITLPFMFDYIGAWGFAVYAFFAFLSFFFFLVFMRETKGLTTD